MYSDQMVGCKSCLCCVDMVMSHFLAQFLDIFVQNNFLVDGALLLLESSKVPCPPFWRHHASLQEAGMQGLASTLCVWSWGTLFTPG